MATRSLTDVYLLMRNNALRSRYHLHEFEQEFSERLQLVVLGDVEQGLENKDEEVLSPPLWIDQLEKAQETLTKLKDKITELKTLHSRHLHRPTFDESSEDEVLIDKCTADISNMFNGVHRLIQIVKSHAMDGSMRERRVTVNVVRSLATSLQELSMQFRATQNGYLRQIQSREERSKVYFENPSLDDYDVFNEDNIDDYFVRSKQITQQQLLFLEEENTKMAQQREQEVTAIVKSIVDLNAIFKDLSQMVADQGTVLDRIDYNIEQTQTKVFEGFKQLQKADAYQRKNRKMCAILVLAVTTILLFFTLIIVKT
ncbi:PREDICTED: syntaxin-16 [Nicrophorus vespilloides]|uniref:Syntaxin-16 n=1 Tax=Nicrophorus vespilloides TaxID=110193 RepID=A0ABM1MFQ5_NICVS|nr:PREDICTED: syntaxin-16 [Nicrophorus vespilloides]